MRSISGVLRLAPLTIIRPRLNRWLDAYAGYPARVLIAPAGSGKTSLLSKYSQSAHRPSVYCALDEDCTLQRMREILAHALDSSSVPQSYCALVRLLNKSAHLRDLIIDNADSGTPEVCEELLRLIDDASLDAPLVLAARSRERLDVRRAVARGVAVLCDAKHLAFDVEDVRALCDACEVEATELDLQRLVDDTDGWALAAAGTIRVASAERVTLARGYEMWREANETFLRDFVDVELRRLAAPERDLFWRLFAGSEAVGGARLRDLEFQGLHVLDEGRGALRLYRPLLPIGIKAAPQREDAFVPPLFVKMFRQFEARIGNREIPWVRRRDQQIVKYLLLKPDGRATREELASVFWSDTDRHLATQSVRTACSTIRRAFAAIVGPSNVDRYFRTVPDVQIDLNHVVCDVRRFVEYANQGDNAFALSGDPQSFLPHYRAAEKLYRGDLLEFEAPETWFTQESRLLRDRFAAVMERLSPVETREAMATA